MPPRSRRRPSASRRPAPTSSRCAVPDPRDARRHGRLLAHARLARYQRTAGGAPRQGAALHPRLGGGGADAHRRDVFRGFSQMARCARPPTRPAGPTTTCCRRPRRCRLRRRAALPDQRSGEAVRAHRLHVAFNMCEQPAASINCGYTGAGLPIGLQIVGQRFDDLGVLQVARAWEADAAGAAALARAAARAYTASSPRFATPRRRPAGNPPARLAAALEQARKALWRMLSFYGTPLDDLDAAILADPGWPLPRVMKAGFLLGLSEPRSRRGSRHARRGRAARRRRTTASAATRGLAPGQRATGRAPPTTGRPAARATARCAGPAVGAAVRLLPRRRRALRERVAPCFRHGARPIRSTPTCSATMPSGSRNRAAMPRPKRSAARPGRHGARAVGDPRRRPCHGDAGPACRRQRGWRPAAVWGGATALPATSAGTRRCSRSRRATTRRPRGVRLYLNAEANEITLQRVDAASLLWRLALHGAEVGDRWQRLLAGWALADRPRPAARPSTTCTRSSPCSAPANATPRQRWMSTSLGGAARGGPWNREVSRSRRAADARAGRLRRRPLR